MRPKELHFFDRCLDEGLDDADIGPLYARHFARPARNDQRRMDAALHVRLLDSSIPEGVRAERRGSW